MLGFDFFKINFQKKTNHKYYQSVKRFGSRSGPTFCRALSGSKLFAKIISRQQILPLAGKESGMCFSRKLLYSRETDRQ